MVIFKVGEKVKCIEDYDATYKDGKVCKKGDIVTIRCCVKKGRTEDNYTYGFIEIGRGDESWENGWCWIHQYFKKIPNTFKDLLE